jgi:hypothetical protein
VDAPYRAGMVAPHRSFGGPDTPADRLTST